MLLLDEVSRQVLVVVEGRAFGDVLRDALTDAGHRGEILAEREDLRLVLRRKRYHVTIVDVDTRARNGSELIAAIREVSPGTMVIALLPCGGLPSNYPRLAYDLALEKPAKLHAILSAVAGRHRHLHPRK